VNTEPTIEQPTEPPPVSGRDPWKIFGIAVIVLAVVGGAVTLGYLLGTSDKSDDATPIEASQSTPAPTEPAPATTRAVSPPTTLPPTTEAPTTTNAGPTAASQLTAIAQAYQNGDDTYGSVFANPTVCRSLTGDLTVISQAKGIIDAALKEIGSQNDIIREIERRPANDEV